MRCQKSLKPGLFNETTGCFPAMFAAKPLDFSLNGTSGHFPAMLETTKPDIHDEMSGQQQCQTRYC